MPSVSCTNGPCEQIHGRKTTPYTATLPHACSLQPPSKNLRAKGRALHLKVTSSPWPYGSSSSSSVNSSLGDGNVSLYHSLRLLSCGPVFELSRPVSGLPTCLSFVGTTFIVCCPAVLEWTCSCSEAGYFSLIQSGDNSRVSRPSETLWKAGEASGLSTGKKTQDQPTFQNLLLVSTLPGPSPSPLQPFDGWSHSAQPPPSKRSSPEHCHCPSDHWKSGSGTSVITIPPLWFFLPSLCTTNGIIYLKFFFTSTHYFS